jgi:hypothetical protein
LRQPFFIAVLVLIAIKVALWVSLGPAAIVGDAHGYWDLSSQVIDGDLMMVREPIAFRTPVYPWFLALGRIVSGKLLSPLLLIVVVQAMMYVATVWLAASLAHRITGQRSAKSFTAALMLPAFSSVTYVGFLVSETLFVFLLMLNLLSVFNYVHNSSRKSALVLGLTFGVTLLTRPIVQLLWVPHLLLILAVHSYARTKSRDDTAQPVVLSWRQRTGHAAIAGLVIACFVVPWLMRNERVFGEPFLTEFMGRNIWVVTFQDGSGAGLAMPATPAADELRSRIFDGPTALQNDDWRRTWSVSRKLTESGLSDPQADQLMKTVAIQAMKTAPKTVSYKTVRRIVNFWRCPATDLPLNNPGYSGFQPYPMTWGSALRENKKGTVAVFADAAHRFRVSQSVALNTLVLALVAIANLHLIWYSPTRYFGGWVAMNFAYFSVITGVLEIPDYRYRMIVEPLAAAVVGSSLAILMSKSSYLQTKTKPELLA